MMSPIILIGILGMIVKSTRANEEIVLAFQNWDLGFKNSQLYELLIFVILAIFVLFLIILVVSLLFKRGYEIYTAREYKTCDLEACLREETERKWRLQEEEKEKQLQQVLIHAELIKMQGDYLPEMENLPPY